MKFTDRQIGSLKTKATRYEVWEGKGFGLRVSPKGRKTWIFMYRFGGRARRLSLGAYPRMTLADAHVAHALAQKNLKNGTDPGAEHVRRRHEARGAPTVADLVSEYLEKWAKPRKRSWREDERILNLDVLPQWGKRKARDITRREVIALIDDVVARGSPIQANRTLACVRKMFNFGVQKDIVPGTPCVAVVAPSSENRRDRVLSEDEIRALWVGLDTAPMAEGTALTLRLQLLSAQRKGEVVAATWDEFELKGGWWTIPPTRTKNKLPHRVPISPQAMAIVERLRALSDGSPWVVPSPVGDKHIRPESVNKALADSLQGMGIDDLTPHDLRRTAATEMAKAGTPRLVIKKILNHAETDITAVYDRAGYDREKRQALEAWGRRLDAILSGEHTNVTAITEAERRRATP